MAMEYKTLDVSNEDETDVIEYWQQFGWELKSSQRIFNRDSHLESRNDSVYSVTNTVNFTKIVLERNTNHPYYRDIVTLEREYVQLDNMYPQITAKEEQAKNSLNTFEKTLDFRSRFVKFVQVMEIAACVIALLILEIADQNSSMPTAVGVPLVLISGIGIIAACVQISTYKKKALKNAIEHPDSKNGKIYYSQKEAYTRAYTSLNEQRLAMERRANEILRSLRKIL